MATQPILLRNPTVPGYYPELTGIRALAAGLVFFHHFTTWVPNGSYGYNPGYLGVTLFFALSGFLITWTYYKSFMNGFPFRNYWLKRVAKIVPAYAVLLLLVTALDGRFSAKGFREWFLNLSLMQGYFYPEVWTGLNPIAWSLTVEESFYLLAPFIFLALKPTLPAPGSRRTFWDAMPSILAITAITAFFWGCFRFIDSFPNRGPFLSGFNMGMNTSIFGRFPEFFPGIALALLCLSGCMNHLLKATARNQESHIGNWLFVSGIALLTVGFTSLRQIKGGYGWDSNSMESTMWDRWIYGAIAVLLIASSITGSRLARFFLGNPLAVYLGKISYVAYLLNAETLYTGLHKAFTFLLPALSQNAIAFFVFFSLAAALGYELIEKPAHQYLKRLWRLDAPRTGLTLTRTRSSRRVKIAV